MQNIPAIIIYSNRKSISIKVGNAGKVFVKAPKNYTKRQINEFLTKNNEWINKGIKLAEINKKRLKEINFDRNYIIKYKVEAKQKFKEKVDFISQNMKIDPKRLKITSATTRWGSCNAKDGINLNYKLIFAPDEVIDYVIVHELAHIKHFNHSKEFWEFVEQFSKDFKYHKKWLKENDYILQLGV